MTGSDTSEPSVPESAATAHRNLYLIIIGVIVGVLLGPAVLGRLAPDTYARLFGDVSLRFKAASFHEVTVDTLEDLHKTGVTEVRPAEVAEQRAREEAYILKPLHDRVAVLNSRMNALVMAVLVMIILESILASAVWRRRLAVVRCALMAAWLALALAHPTLLADLSWPFVILLVIVALVAALVPLRRAPQSANPP
jgi:hypothetical protein